jgi:hypothetical protein
VRNARKGRGRGGVLEELVSVFRHFVVFVCVGGVLFEAEVLAERGGSTGVVFWGVVGGWWGRRAMELVAAGEIEARGG